MVFGQKTTTPSRNGTEVRGGAETGLLLLQRDTFGIVYH